MKSSNEEQDEQELRRIRRAINDPTHYGKLVDGVHTWDVSEIFKDFRKVIQIARRALKQKAQRLSIPPYGETLKRTPWLFTE